MIEQERYQVRFDWGAAGAAAIGEDAHVLVWVDELDPVDPPSGVRSAGRLLLTTGLAGAAVTAARVLEMQEARQDRTVVAVVAAGDSRGGATRFAVEDLLAAGAVMDELEARGIDAMSPEAAAADAAYRGLRPGLDSLLRSVSGAAPPRADGASGG